MSVAADSGDPLADALVEHLDCAGEVSVDHRPGEIRIRCSGCGAESVVALATPDSVDAAPVPAPTGSPQGAVLPVPPSSGTGGAPPSPEVAAARHTLARSGAARAGARRLPRGLEAEPSPGAPDWRRRAVRIALLAAVLAAVVAAVLMERSSDPPPETAATDAPRSQDRGGTGARDAGRGGEDAGRGGTAGGSGGSEGRPGATPTRGGDRGGKESRGGAGKGGSAGVGELEETLVRGLFPIGVAPGWRQSGTTPEGGVRFVPESPGEASVTVFTEQEAGLGPRALARRTADFLRSTGLTRVGRPRLAGGVGTIRAGSPDLRVLARTSIRDDTAIVGVATAAASSERRALEAEAMVESLPG